MDTVKRRHQQIILALGLAILAILFMYWQRTVFNPFLLAFALAYILNPAINWMEKRRIPRKLAIIFVFFALLATIFNLVIWLAPVVATEMSDWYITAAGEPFEDVNGNRLYDSETEKDSWVDENNNGIYDGPKTIVDTEGNEESIIPGEYYLDLNNNDQFDPDLGPDIPGEDINGNGRYDRGYVGRLADRLLRDGEADLLHSITDRFMPREQWKRFVAHTMATLRDNVSTIATRAQGMVGSALKKSMAAAEWFWNLGLLAVLTPIYLAFLLYSMNLAWEGFVRNVPEYIRPRFLEITKKIDTVIGSFFRGRLLVCLAIALFTSIGFLFCGVKFGLLLGLLIGIASFIPFLNTIPLAVTLLVCWIDGMGLYWMGGVLLVYCIGQALDPLLMTLVVGKDLQLHPVTVLLAIFVGGSVLGFLGLLLAIPIVAVAKILFQELILPYLHEAADDKGQTASKNQ